MLTRLLTRRPTLTSRGTLPPTAGPVASQRFPASKKAPSDSTENVGRKIALI